MVQRKYAVPAPTGLFPTQIRPERGGMFDIFGPSRYEQRFGQNRPLGGVAAANHQSMRVPFPPKYKQLIQTPGYKPPFAVKPYELPNKVMSVIREDTGVWLDATKGHNGRPGWFEFADPSKPLSRSYTENLSIDINDRIHRWTNKMISVGFFDIGTRPNQGAYLTQDSYGNVANMELFPLWLGDTGVPVSKMDDSFMRQQYLLYRKANNDAWGFIRDVGLPCILMVVPGVAPTPAMTKPSPAPEYYKSNNPYYPKESQVIKTASPNTAVPPENPTAYSTAFEMKLQPADLGRSRSVQFNRANAALDESLGADADFATSMDSLIPGVKNSVSSVGGRATPSGWTWEHASTSTASGEKGVMRLVPEGQHTPGSPWWRVLHPDAGAAGGYSEWAIPNGAPKN